MGTCKGCGASVHSQTTTLPPDYAPGTGVYATEEVYRKRIAACEVCPAFQYGTTCEVCGCLVEYRARFINKGCPCPAGDKWVLKGSGVFF